MAINWYRYASPASFYPLAGRLIPWFGWSAAALAVAGLAVVSAFYLPGSLLTLIRAATTVAWGAPQ